MHSPQHQIDQMIRAKGLQETPQWKVLMTKTRKKSENTLKEAIEERKSAKVSVKSQDEVVK